MIILFTSSREHMHIYTLIHTYAHAHTHTHARTNTYRYRMKYTNIQNLRFQDWLRSYRSHGSYQSFFLQVQALPANIPAYIHNMQGVLPTDSQGARMCVCAFECGCVCGSVRMHICICCIYTYACMSANKCISSLSIIQKRTDITVVIRCVLISSTVKLLL